MKQPVGSDGLEVRKNDRVVRYFFVDFFFELVDRVDEGFAFVERLPADDLAEPVFVLDVDWADADLLEEGTFFRLRKSAKVLRWVVVKTFSIAAISSFLSAASFSSSS
jgi:hypothetical protein